MELTIEEYIKRYIKLNLYNKKYERNDILVLISNYLNLSKEKLFLNIKNIRIKDEKIKELDSILNKYYIENIPLQYITHKQLFFNEEYYVDENVLIPRQDTEILVEEAIKYINKYNFKSLLDMCTGSGCIGISISNNSSIENITLVDISKEALEVVRKNIKLNNVKKNITTIQSDLFNNLKDKEFDIIVSNPPYIKTNDISSLDEHVKKEPYIALDGGIDGMYIYIRILNEAKDHLSNNGLLILEIGYDELEDIKEIITMHNEYELIDNIRDLGNNDRVVVIRVNNRN